jgi:hypothetical protein
LFRLPVLDFVFLRRYRGESSGCDTILNTGEAMNNRRQALLLSDRGSYFMAIRDATYRGNFIFFGAQLPWCWTK